MSQLTDVLGNRCLRHCIPRHCGPRRDMEIPHFANLETFFNRLFDIVKPRFYIRFRFFDGSLIDSAPPVASEDLLHN